MCVWRNTVSESSHISFFCGGDPFCEVVRRPENRHEELTGLLEWPTGLFPFASENNRPLPFAWVTSGSLPSVKNYRPYIVFSGPMRKYEHPLRLTWLSELTYFCFFFPVIFWSYLQTELSVTLSTDNKWYSSLSSFIFSFRWPTLLMLFWDHIEPAKSIHSTLLLAKLVYYTSVCVFNAQSCHWRRIVIPLNP